MTATVRCRGRVLDAEGQPIEGAVITISNAVPEMGLLSGDGGAFEVLLAPHRYRFVAIGPGDARVETDVDVGETLEVVLRLPRPR
jgi:hypothetical protein